MKKSDFYFDLPNELIAQEPMKDRDACRLLVMDKKTGELRHKNFYDIVEFLNKGDCLVLNDTKVLPARLYGQKSTGAKVEFLLLKDLGFNRWEVLTGPGRRAKKNDKFTFGDGVLECEIEEVLENGDRIAKFYYDGNNIYEILDKIGETPLPHYITRELKNKDDYQTVYAKVEGSAAAPTAGLHFTKDLLKKIENMGVNLAYITLHVGVGTFRPVKAENIENHKMHEEYYRIPKDAADKINDAKENGKKIIAVGTTSCRTLESSSDENGKVKECSGVTDIFIYPGYKWKCVDSLITNFHLPESTLIMLVSSLSTRENILNAYNEAIKEKYRFFSFGDAMFIN